MQGARIANEGIISWLVSMVKTSFHRTIRSLISIRETPCQIPFLASQLDFLACTQGLHYSRYKSATAQAVEKCWQDCRVAGQKAIVCEFLAVIRQIRSKDTCAWYRPTRLRDRERP